ncbi:MAG: MBOAT family protein [Spirosomaceae bacterium]|jgi:D-alanyl-lipoteichoic acid acyltransferase DltB (MBOAT superfamily)|nr:MBOAT family protein [Spirosomataceae bacterium]
MLFNELQFIFFFIVVTILYYQLPQRGRVWLLLLASCYFYMVFMPIYILILAVTIVVDYYAGIWIERAEGAKRKWLLIISLISNVGFLAYFKYFNFFVKNVDFLAYKFDFDNPFDPLSILLPIGLSFHTFQAMSYTIEVYRRNQPAERDFVVYALYVMFYPQLVAGPIERPQNVLWQFHSKFKYDFENIKEGLIRIAWGMFKKVVIADRLSIVVHDVYGHAADHNGLSLLIATIFFTFQIYCDFSGYSDIAIGAARVMGFKLMENFDTPYFSKSISEFWRRWHISLSTWFRDYLYISLGGNRVSEARIYFNLFFVFMMSGLWHGANWTFVVWGSLHGIYLVLARLRDKFFHFSLPQKPFFSFINMAFTFVLVMLTWIFFAANGMSHALLILKKIFGLSIHDTVQSPLNNTEMIFCWILIALLMLKDKFIKFIPTDSTPKFYFIFITLLILTYFFGVFSSNQFIYFQF